MARPDSLAADDLTRRLYPDVVAAGGLAEALTQAATGLDLGEIQKDPSDPWTWTGVPSLADGREPYTINLGAEERWFIGQGWSRGAQLISGSTPSLAETARAANAWRRGRPLAEIRAAAPFIEVSDLAFAHERGPEHAVTVKWRLVREQARDAPADGVRALVEAAHTEPRLRQLFPFLSMWSLHFSTCTGYPFVCPLPQVIATGDGRF
ncbi:DUF6193 family natural product biosynthesis protein [Nonomuraea sp. NPDC050310]|uniref:DUF6193 family natural product biosynthesis protein n=1 Tax=Nonomuraea sp. NPDC050310 TaxID=3154935 RepID=UPI0033E4AD18